MARLEDVFAQLDEKVRGKHCEGMAGIIEEGKAVLEEDFNDATLDACLIASGQRAEHYEMAACGTLVAWARVLSHDDAAAVLEEILDEEKNADATLSSLAEGGVNRAAARPRTDDDGTSEGGIVQTLISAVTGKRAPKPAKTAAKSPGRSAKGAKTRR